jgi:hypothetical protein
VWGWALVALAAGTGSARAAWDNVFQTCCWGCNHGSTSHFAAASPCCPQPCPQPCPQQQCTTRYVQRCFYQPVTTYKTETYLEPVTTYKTSYYYEPVTTMRCSTYYDPCTGCPHQCCTPCTSFRLRSQCCPVTSYLQRTCCKPCTSYQLSYYWEPQTTCCTTTVGAPIFTQPTGGVGTGFSQGFAPSGVAPSGIPPSATDGHTTPYPAGPSGVPSAGDTGGAAPPTSSDSRKFPETPVMPPASPNSYRQPQLGPPVNVTPEPPPAPPKAAVRLDKIVSLPKANVEGAVVGPDRRPQANARILFVSVDRQRAQEEVTADRAGGFGVSLASGQWLVYTYGADGRPVYHRKVDVRDDVPSRLTLDNR